MKKRKDMTASQRAIGWRSVFSEELHGRGRRVHFLFAGDNGLAYRACIPSRIVNPLLANKAKFIKRCGGCMRQIQGAK